MQSPLFEFRHLQNVVTVKRSICKHNVPYNSIQSSASIHQHLMPPSLILHRMALYSGHNGINHQISLFSLFIAHIEYFVYISPFSSNLFKITPKTNVFMCYYSIIFNIHMNTKTPTCRCLIIFSLNQSSRRNSFHSFQNPSDF